MDTASNARRRSGNERPPWSRLAKARPARVGRGSRNLVLPPFTAAVRRAAHLVWRRRVRASLERPDACSLFGLDLVIEPGVLHPRHFASSRLLARHVLSLDLPDREIADVGTGSGLLALLAARSGARALALDINPEAVGCASRNARRNGLAER
ncbi:MAG: 50S ribosomal protein L11 methyltransferase, partial [Vicinamibacteria bacterium]|nr:50S ribosomal protein L11 methyltransferase [Vicinamibacteria bacterium]